MWPGNQLVVVSLGNTNFSLKPFITARDNHVLYQAMVRAHHVGVELEGGVADQIRPFLVLQEGNGPTREPR